MGTKLQANRTLLTTKGDTMKTTLKRNLLLTLILVSLSALLGCAHDCDCDKTRKVVVIESNLHEPEIDSLKAGQIWQYIDQNPFSGLHKCRIVAVRDGYVQWRFYDSGCVSFSDKVDNFMEYWRRIR